MEFSCGQCGGSGTHLGDSCSMCGGDGNIDLLDARMRDLDQGTSKALLGIIWDVLLSNTTLPANVFRSYKVLECVDATEHAALTDAQKDGVLHILACGHVDLREGKAGRVRLWNWFGAESTTVSNLTALLA